MNQSKRIGIYPGTFDPVHVGHIAFALQAMKSARLDYVYFLPERSPRRKEHASHYGHRVAMLRRALRPHTKLGMLDLATKRFSVMKTLPEVQAKVGKHTTLVFLVGSDVAMYVPSWENAGVLAKQSELCIGLRESTTEDMVRNVLSSLPFSPEGLTVIRAFASDVSSSKIRSAIITGRFAHGLLRSVYGYARQEWLYI